MKIFVSNTYEEMSRLACHDFLEIVTRIEFPLICPASGDTPAGLYKELVKHYQQKKLSIDGWSFVGLDEWAGMDETDEGSCKFHMNNQLFEPLQTSQQQVIFFRGREKDLDVECARIEQFLKIRGEIDLAILGLGLNGHVGMNEPNTDPSLRTHLSSIDPVTQQEGQKYFIKPRPLTHGITLGIANIMESKHIFLLVSGNRKAGMVKKVIESDITEKIPATQLRMHEGLRIYLDKPAAGLLGL